MCCSFFQISAERQKEITSMSLAELTAALQSNEVSAAEALVSYQMAALEVHEKTNCLVEPLWEAEVSKAMVGWKNWNLESVGWHKKKKKRKKDVIQLFYQKVKCIVIPVHA